MVVEDLQKNQWIIFIEIIICLLELSRVFSLNGFSDIKGGGCWLGLFDCDGSGIRGNIFGGSGGPKDIVWDLFSNEINLKIPKVLFNKWGGGGGVCCWTWWSWTICCWIWLICVWTWTENSACCLSSWAYFSSRPDSIGSIIGAYSVRIASFDLKIKINPFF